MLEARSLAQAVAEEEAEAPATVADVEPSAVEGDAPAAVAAGGPAAGVGVEPEEVAVEEEAAALAQDQPGEAVVDEATAGAAAEAETLDVDLEIPDDLFEELEEEREKMETAAPKVKKGRAARKELQTMIEEELDEEEPLPSLFDGDDEDDSEEPAVFVVDGGRSEPAPKRESQPPKIKPATGKKDKEKVVLKDFSQLAALLGSADDEEEDKES